MLERALDLIEHMRRRRRQATRPHPAIETLRSLYGRARHHPRCDRELGGAAYACSCGLSAALEEARTIFCEQETR